MIDVAYPSLRNEDDGTWTVGPISRDAEAGYLWHYWIPFLCALNPHLFRLRALDEVLAEGGPFLFPLELRWEFLEYFTKGYTRQFLTPYIPPGVVKALRRGRACLLLSYGHEARRFSDLPMPDGKKKSAYDMVAGVMQRQKLPAGSVWFINGNVAGQTEFDDWKQKHARDSVPFEVRCIELFSFLLQSLQRLHAKGNDLILRWDFEKSKNSDPVHKALHFKFEPLSCSYSDIYADPADAAVAPRRLFLCMNRITRPHRRIVVCYLELDGLLERSLVSFRDHEPHNTHFDDPKMEEAWQSIQKKQPLTIDRDFPLDFTSVYREGFSSFKPGQAWPYRETLFNITNESYYGNETCFTSEKIWKPIINGQPFIVVGTPGSLEYIRSLGFRTFAPLIDESYDSIVDDQRRMKQIQATIHALGALSTEKVTDVCRQLQPVVEHNMRHMQAMVTPMERLMKEIAVKLGVATS